MSKITKQQFLKFAKEELWTTNELCKIFEKHAVTLIEWKKNKKLPFISLRNNSKHKAIFFIKKEVMEWAKKNGIKYNLSKVKKQNVKN